MDLGFSEIHFRRRRSLSADAKVCSGCRTCEVICSLIHEGLVDTERSRILIKSNVFKGSFIPAFCHQCSDVPCYYACPESAIEIESLLGTVTIHEEKCTGCQTCQESCPFGAIHFDREKNKAFKCDFCQGDPECVKWCPTNALGTTQFGGEIPK